MEKGIEVIFEGFFGYKKGLLYAEDVPVTQIAEKYGTPAYVYSKNSLLSRVRNFQSAFDGIDSLVCYSVKANSNLSILKVLKENSLGADVVSGGELQRAILAGFPPEKIVFAGVGKKEDEIEQAVKKNITCINIENEGEIRIVEKFAKKYKRRVSCNLRLNLDIDVDTHHYVKTSKKETKFGLDIYAAEDIIKKNSRNRYVKLKGFHLHLGSQLKDVSPYLKALEKVKQFSQETGFHPEIIDIGGGFGIPYTPTDSVKDIGTFGKSIVDGIKDMGIKTLILEPGRYIIGNTAVLLSRVLYVKKRQDKVFVIMDAGMNDLIRPAFYGSIHTILPVKIENRAGSMVKADIVGPICETGDYLGKDVEVPAGIKPGDLLVVAGAGAYCSSMSSNYNSRPRPCEVMVEGKKLQLIRKREVYSDLWCGEV